MTFLADVSRELVCEVPAKGTVRFDPSQATLIFQRISFLEYGSDEEYYFVTPEKKYIWLLFPRRGIFRKSLDPPRLHELDKENMLAHLSVSKCPLEVIEKHFGRQEVK